MRKRNLSKGDIVLPIEDGEIVGFAIYLEQLEMNGKKSHVVLDTAVFGSEDGTVVPSVSEYDTVLDLKESPEVLSSIYYSEGRFPYEKN